jgi:isoquinoline 1-oxidoreductase subunit beta
VKRREFLAALGALGTGLALGSFEGEVLADAAKTELAPNAFVHVAATGVVSIVCARSEMGQGVRSTLPALIAEELGADTTKIRIVQADADKMYGDQNTDGSSSVRMDFERLRRVGAAARMMLTSVAAKRWNVPESACVAKDHAIHHPPTKRLLAFGDLVADAAKLPVPKDDAIVLRPRVDLGLLKRDLPHVDAPDIVTGRAIYGADVMLPGMLTAVIARPPVVGGSVARYDAKKALAVPGVKAVIPLASPKRPYGFQPLGGLAVVAEHTWAALRGRGLLDVTWEGGENAVYDSHTYREELASTARKPARVVRNVGDANAALGRAKRKIEALYQTPHLAHATMEPPVAVAKIDGKRCEIWAPTQDPQTARDQVAKALGLDEKDVTVHVTLLGGGFGRKSKPDFILEAALVAKAVGAPVRLQWSREDDLRHDYYHSTAAQRLEAGFDDAGNVIAWQHRTVFPPIASTFKEPAIAEAGALQQGLLDVPLAVPNVRAECGNARSHTRIGWLRSVANIYHAFAIQSFIDEIAEARGKDPRDNLFDMLGPPRLVDTKALGLERLPNYGHPFAQHPIDTSRHRRVIERVTEAAGWSRRGSRALGLAVHRSFVTYVAVVISVVPRGKGIAIDEAWICADAGTVVNRDRVRAQLEGSVVFALGHALYGAITMKNGATEQATLRDYRIMRLPEVPRSIHVDIVDSEGPPGGVGEPGVPPVAPALTNAIFALTKKRVRDLPVSRVMTVDA